MWLRPFFGVVVFAGTLAAAYARPPEPRVLQVQPSSDYAPTNLLRLSIEFSAPIEGPVLPRIALELTNGVPLQEAFLQQELWSPDGKTLTLLLHPGRVKTGLIARERLGPILRAGDDVILTLDSRPIKQWHIGPVDANGPAPSAWRLSTVHAGVRDALLVTLDGPIDGQEADYIAVVDATDIAVDGHATLIRGEGMWRFDPDKPWHAGRYRLAIRGTLEDPAGNRVGGHFETPIGEPPSPTADVFVTFVVNPPSSPE